VAVKRFARIVGGFLLLAAGAAMVILPGPGWLTIALGLAVLARDYPWARRWLDRLKKTAVDVRDRVTGRPKQGAA
jgi:tellurite resistance protein TerC